MKNVKSVPRIEEVVTIFIVNDLQLCVHNILVLLYDFSSILYPIFEASIIKSQIFITQFLKTSISNLDSSTGSCKKPMFYNRC